MQETRAIPFGPWLKARRHKQRLTQEQLAQRVHCATATIRKLEACERLPSLQLAELLAMELGVAPHSYEAFLQFARTGMGSRTLLTRIETGIQAPQETIHARDTDTFTRAFGLEQLRARAAYLIDAGSDQLLLDRHGHQRLLIASTTKIMTALIALEQANLSQRVTIRSDILEQVNRYRCALAFYLFLSLRPEKAWLSDGCPMIKQHLSLREEGKRYKK